MIDSFEIYEEKQAQGICREEQLGSFHFKAKFSGGRMGNERNEQITEQETPGMGKEISKEETYSEYGNDARGSKLNR